MKTTTLHLKRTASCIVETAEPADVSIVNVTDGHHNISVSEDIGKTSCDALQLNKKSAGDRGHSASAGVCYCVFSLQELLMFFCVKLLQMLN